MLARRNRYHGHLKAFTLIEVLVVVAIIALLIAILMPALAAARESARNSMCLSNQHQFGLAIASYVATSKGYIVRGGDPNTPHWTILVARMLGDARSYTYNGTYEPNMLPVDKRPVYQCAAREDATKKPFVDYVANDLSPGGPSGGKWSAGESVMKLDMYKRPGEVVFLADAERLDKNTSAGYCTWLTDAYKNWVQIHENPALGASISGIDAMDVWVGEHLPEGVQNNTSDAKGPRRVARKMHLRQYTNCVFFDGHATGVPLCPTSMTPPQNWSAPQVRYATWLRRFGVQEKDVITITLPNGQQTPGPAVTANPGG